MPRPLWGVALRPTALQTGRDVLPEHAAGRREVFVPAEACASIGTGAGPNALPMLYGWRVWALAYAAKRSAASHNKKPASGG